MIREKTARFGEGKCLSGIVSDSQNVPHAGSRPAFILLNAGLLHRVGPSRLHVKISRRLAAEGYVSLRFDSSGIGDSDIRKGSMSLAQRELIEVQESMDYLAGRGIERFVLFGICSGADAAFQVAKVDSRVTGIVLGDGFAYRNFRFFVRYLGRRILKLSKWKSAMMRMMNRLVDVAMIRKLSRKSNTSSSSTFVRDFPPRNEVTSGIRSLVDQGVSQYYIYTGGYYMFYNYQEQFRDTFRSVSSRGKIRVDFLEEADHLFTSLVQQKSLTNAIVDWARTNWP